MSHYWEDILNLLPVFCTAKYRGGVRRTEGLKNSIATLLQDFYTPPPLPCPVALRSVTKQHGKKAAFQSSSPVFCTAKYRGGVRRTEGLKNSIATLL